LANRELFDRILIPVIILLLYNFAAAYPGLTAETGGGYSSNLYADSFSIGDSYLLSAVSISDTEFKTTKFRIYYDLVYYQYDTRNSINQFDHLAGLSLFRNLTGDKFKWSIEAAGTYRDYTEDNSDYDNSKFFLRGNGSYYLIPGLRLKFNYLFESSSYSGFNNLNNSGHRIDGEITKTFPSRTTARANIQYSRRQFSIDNSLVDWLDLELKLTQSIDLRTGISGSGSIRFAGDGTRPLSSYYYISGITPYWDPWDGYQFNLSVKRILPWGVVAVADFDYWNRTFKYSQSQQSELPWLSGISSRDDKGWLLKAEIKRQFNLYGKFGRAVRITLMPGYFSNSSDDLYYKYDYIFINLSAKLDLF